MNLSFCCWQPLLTAHQAHTLKALADRTGGDLKVVSVRREDDVRSKQGWTASDDRVLIPELLPRRGWRRRIRAIIGMKADRIHIFGSPFEISKQSFALILALFARRSVYLISEPYSPVSVSYLDDGGKALNLLKVKVRPLLYRLYGMLLRGRVSGVFAISRTGIEQFTRMGVPKAKIFPFGYFVPREQNDRPVDEQMICHLRVAYLGSFIERKGVRTLVDAFGTDAVKNSGATLDLFGPVDTYQVESPSDAVRYRGPLPFGAVQPALAIFDLLVVPSLYDGWAVVVNEAILASVPVLASTAVGAGGMIEKWGCGETFKAGDAEDLARKITALAADRERLATYKRATSILARLIEPEVAAVYMAQCIKADLDGAVPPTAPWY